MKLKFLVFCFFVLVFLFSFSLTVFCVQMPYLWSFDVPDNYDELYSDGNFVSDPIFGGYIWQLEDAGSDIEANFPIFDYRSYYDGFHSISSILAYDIYISSFSLYSQYEIEFFYGGFDSLILQSTPIIIKGSSLASFVSIAINTAGYDRLYFNCNYYPVEFDSNGQVVYPYNTSNFIVGRNEITSYVPGEFYNFNFDNINSNSYYFFYIYSFFSNDDEDAPINSLDLTVRVSNNAEIYSFVEFNSLRRITSSQYNNAYNSGYNVGLDEGYDDGYDSGYAVGRDAGYELGLNEGFDLGESQGFDRGYQLGFDDGVASTSSGTVDFTSWLGTAVGGFLNFEIFPGFNMSGILLIIISFSLVMWFLKVFAGG